MKNLALSLVFASSIVAADPYIMYENDWAFENFDKLGSFEDTESTLRVGTTLGENFYVEYGRFGEGTEFNTGDSAEAGYKFNLGNNFVVEGKVESKKVDDWNHKLTTEVKYFFR